MALIKCKECGKEISDKAESCPNCGYKITPTSTVKPSNQIRTGSIVSIIANVIAILILACILIASNLPSNPEPDNSGGVTVEVQGTPNVVAPIYATFILSSLILAIFCTVLAILFLCGKIKNVKIYKAFFLISSTIELVTSILAVFGFVCCGMFYAIFPLISFIGAIIVATGKAK